MLNVASILSLVDDATDVYNPFKKQDKEKINNVYVQWKFLN